MFFLGVSDGVAFWVPTCLSAVSLIVAMTVSIVTWKISNIIRGYERVEDRDQKSLKAAEQRLHELTTKLIDERFRAMTHEVNNHMQGLLGTIDELKNRLQSGDEVLDGLSDRDQKIELAVASRFDQLKDWIRESCASKGDVKEHERAMHQHLGELNKDMGKLGREVAVLGEQVKQAAAAAATAAEAAAGNRRA